MYRFIIERGGKIVHLRGQKYSPSKENKIQFLNKILKINLLQNRHDKEHLFYE